MMRMVCTLKLATPAQLDTQMRIIVVTSAGVIAPIMNKQKEEIIVEIAVNGEWTLDKPGQQIQGIPTTSPTMIRGPKRLMSKIPRSNPGNPESATYIGSR